MRTFEWLKRWQECGTPCQRCARECPVQSIHPEGNINPNECIYCMHCQELYHAEDRCPHNIQKAAEAAEANRDERGATARRQGPPKDRHHPEREACDRCISHGARTMNQESSMSANHEARA
jgi:polyferredoxin